MLTASRSLLEPAEIVENAAKIGVCLGRARAQLHGSAVARDCLIRPTDRVQGIPKIIVPISFVWCECDDPRHHIDGLWHLTHLEKCLARSPPAQQVSGILCCHAAG